MKLLGLIVLALVWGSSFMLIKLAERELPADTVVFLRTAIAAVTLSVVAIVSLGAAPVVSALRARAGALLLVGVTTMAVPFTLLAWGETLIPSGVASVIQASVPIFNALLAVALFSEQRPTVERLAGVAVGFAGVALLMGWQGSGELIGDLAVLAMSACYSLGGLLTVRLLDGADPRVVALGSALTAALVTAPFGLAHMPAGTPHATTLASIALLGVLGTGLAYILYFKVVAREGSAYASLVMYLVPPVALGYGSLVLHEPLHASACIGLGLILGGVAIAGHGNGLMPTLKRWIPARVL